jgi:hypothetical protein
MPDAKGPRARTLVNVQVLPGCEVRLEAAMHARLPSGARCTMLGGCPRRTKRQPGSQPGHARSTEGVHLWSAGCSCCLLRPCEGERARNPHHLASDGSGAYCLACARITRSL